MIKKILDATAIEYNETRFLYPPKGTYAVWLRSTESRGADSKILIDEYSVRIELYSPKPDIESEFKIAREISKYAIPYETTERLWLNTEKLYMTTFSFDYIEKRGNNDD